MAFMLVAALIGGCASDQTQLGKSTSANPASGGSVSSEPSGGASGATAPPAIDDGRVGTDDAGTSTSLRCPPFVPKPVEYDCAPRPRTPDDCPPFDDPDAGSSLGYPLGCGATVTEPPQNMPSCQPLQCSCTGIFFDSQSRWLCPD